MILTLETTGIFFFTGGSIIISFIITVFDFFASLKSYRDDVELQQAANDALIKIVEKTESIQDQAGFNAHLQNTMRSTRILQRARSSRQTPGVTPAAD